MKIIMAIPIMIAKTVVDLFFGANEITRDVQTLRGKAQFLMVMGRMH